MYKQDIINGINWRETREYLKLQPTSQQGWGLAYHFVQGTWSCMNFGYI